MSYTENDSSAKTFPQEKVKKQEELENELRCILQKNEEDLEKNTSPESWNSLGDLRKQVLAKLDLPDPPNKNQILQPVKLRSKGTMAMLGAILGVVVFQVVAVSQVLEEVFGFEGELSIITPAGGIAVFVGASLLSSRAK